jgi:cell wall-associated NlpC family hydrolase
MNYRKQEFFMNKQNLFQAGIFSMVLVFAMTGVACATVSPMQELPHETVPVGPPPEDALRQSVIDAGEKYLGAKYVYGAQSPATMEFDCAGFLSYAFLEGASLKLPRSSKDIALVGREVPPDQLRVGDVVYFDTDDSDGQRAVTHVAIYVGPNRLLHAISWPPAKAGVQFTGFKEDRDWYSRVLGYRNVIGE